MGRGQGQAVHRDRRQRHRPRHRHRRTGGLLPQGPLPGRRLAHRPHPGLGAVEELGGLRRRGRQFVAKTPNVKWYDAAGNLFTGSWPSSRTPSTTPTASSSPRPTRRSSRPGTRGEVDPGQAVRGLAAVQPRVECRLRAGQVRHGHLPRMDDRLHQRQRAGHDRASGTSPPCLGFRQLGRLVADRAEAGQAQKEATELAKYLTRRGNALAVLKENGNFPSLVDTWTKPEVTGLRTRSSPRRPRARSSRRRQEPDSADGSALKRGDIGVAFDNALNKVEQGKADPDDALERRAEGHRRSRRLTAGRRPGATHVTTRSTASTERVADRTGRSADASQLCNTAGTVACQRHSTDRGPGVSAWTAPARRTCSSRRSSSCSRSSGCSRWSTRSMSRMTALAGRSAGTEGQFVGLDNYGALLARRRLLERAGQHLRHRDPVRPCRSCCSRSAWRTCSTSRLRGRHVVPDGRAAAATSPRSRRSRSSSPSSSAATTAWSTGCSSLFGVGHDRLAGRRRGPSWIAISVDGRLALDRLQRADLPGRHAGDPVRPLRGGRDRRRRHVATVLADHHPACCARRSSSPSIVSTIGGLQLFTEPLLFDTSRARRTAAPHRQFQTVAMYMYEQFWFRRFQYGYGSAIAWVLFLLIADLRRCSTSCSTRRIAGRTSR